MPQEQMSRGPIEISQPTAGLDQGAMTLECRKSIEATLDDCCNRYLGGAQMSVNEQRLLQALQEAMVEIKRLEDELAGVRGKVLDEALALRPTLLDIQANCDPEAWLNRWAENLRKLTEKAGS